MNTSGDTSEKPNFPFIAKFIRESQVALFKDNKLEPIFVFSKNNECTMEPIPGYLMEPKHKDALVQVLNHFVGERNPDCFFLLASAYFTKLQVASVEDAQEELQKIKEAGGIGRLPNSRREEVVMCSLCDRKDNKSVRWLGSFNIIRDRNKVVRNFGPLLWTKCHATDTDVTNDGLIM